MLGFASGLRINKYESEGWCRGHSHIPPVTSLKFQSLHVCCPPPSQAVCHLPAVVFIIEMLKAYSVAEVIHHHLQQALVCVRPTGLTVSTS